MQIYLCEDIIAHAEQLNAMLEECTKECNIQAEIKSFTNASELLEDLRKKKETGKSMPNLLFSDIKMPEMSGIALGKILNEEMPEICLVFLTAYEEYAIAGYETGAYRYLLKPIVKEQVVRILQDISAKMAKEYKILLNEAGEKHCISIKDIIYISAEDKYIIIHTNQGEYLDRGSLTEYENRLKEYGFYRVHRKYLINMRYNKKIANGKVILSNGEEILIGRRREGEFRTAFVQYLERGLLQ